MLCSSKSKFLLLSFSRSDFINNFTEGLELFSVSHKQKKKKKNLW